MAKGIIGQYFTFQAIFTDEDGSPISLNTPTISVYRWAEDGVRETLVLEGTTLPSSVPAEVGRYAYTLLIPGDLSERDVLYGLLQGEHPVSGNTLRVEQEVNLYVASSVSPMGMTVRFIG